MFVPGIIGLVLRYITPLTIAPAVAMIGLALFDVSADMASKHWGVAAMTVVIMVLFSQYLRNIPLPGCHYSPSKRGFVKSEFHVFKLFPVLISIMFMWGFCGVLTATDVFSEGSPARQERQFKLII